MTIRRVIAHQEREAYRELRLLMVRMCEQLWKTQTTQVLTAMTATTLPFAFMGGDFEGFQMAMMNLRDHWEVFMEIWVQFQIEAVLREEEEGSARASSSNQL